MSEPWKVALLDAALDAGRRGVWIAWLFVEFMKLPTPLSLALDKILLNGSSERRYPGRVRADTSNQQTDPRVSKQFQATLASDLGLPDHADAVPPWVSGEEPGGWAYS